VTLKCLCKTKPQPNLTTQYSLSNKMVIKLKYRLKGGLKTMRKRRMSNIV